MPHVIYRRGIGCNLGLGVKASPRAPRKLSYCIEKIDLQNRIITVDSSIPISEAKICRLESVLLKNRPVVTECTESELGTRYHLSFKDIPLETTWPQLYPTWENTHFVLPLCAILLYPKTNKPFKVKISLDRNCCLKTNVQLISPRKPISADAIGNFLLIGGFLRHAVRINCHLVYLNIHQSLDCDFVIRSVKQILSAHHRYFKKWIWDRLDLVFELQTFGLTTAKGCLSVAKKQGVGRFILKARPFSTHMERLVFMDLVEHEVLHYYIDSTEDAGDWIVEGLTTFLSRKLLVNAGLFTNSDWQMFMKKAYSNYLSNPLASKTSIAKATKKFWNPHYANILYNKGFLIGELLDREIGSRLVEIALLLFKQKVSKGTPFTKEEFLNLLPPYGKKLLQRLIRKGSLEKELQELSFK